MHKKKKILYKFVILIQLRSLTLKAHCFVVVSFLFALFCYLFCFLLCYHTLHLCVGFMGDPNGQLNCLAKSIEFDTVPITRNLPGLCMAVLSLLRTASGRIAPHHT